MRTEQTGRVTVTFAGSGDAFGSGARLQTCIHLAAEGHSPVLLDCGATSMVALHRQQLDPHKISTVFVTHLHVDHFGGLPPYHLRHVDLLTHKDQLTSEHTILTHMSTDMLGHADEAAFDLARDGVTLAV